MPPTAHYSHTQSVRASRPQCCKVNTCFAGWLSLLERGIPCTCHEAARDDSRQLSTASCLSLQCSFSLTFPIC
jgi:hypothetical protein